MGEANCTMIDTKLFLSFVAFSHILISLPSSSYQSNGRLLEPPCRQNKPSDHEQLPLHPGVKINSNHSVSNGFPTNNISHSSCILIRAAALLYEDVLRRTSPIPPCCSKIGPRGASMPIKVRIHLTCEYMMGSGLQSTYYSYD